MGRYLYKGVAIALKKRWELIPGGDDDHISERLVWRGFVTIKKIRQNTHNYLNLTTHILVFIARTNYVLGVVFNVKNNNIKNVGSIITHGIYYRELKEIVS